MPSVSPVVASRPPSARSAHDKTVPVWPSNFLLFPQGVEIPKAEVRLAADDQRLAVRRNRDAADRVREGADGRQLPVRWRGPNARRAVPSWLDVKVLPSGLEPRGTSKSSPDPPEGAQAAAGLQVPNLDTGICRHGR